MALSFLEWNKLDEENRSRYTQSINEGDIKDEDGFREYAETILKKAHPDDYDEDKAKKTIDGIIKKYAKDGKDWGAAIGVLTSSLGG